MYLFKKACTAPRVVCEELCATRWRVRCGLVTRCRNTLEMWWCNWYSVTACLSWEHGGSSAQQEVSRADLPVSRCDTEQCDCSSPSILGWGTHVINLWCRSKFCLLCCVLSSKLNSRWLRAEEFSDNQEEMDPADHIGCQRDGGELKWEQRIWPGVKRNKFFQDTSHVPSRETTEAYTVPSPHSHTTLHLFRSDTVSWFSPHSAL